jgi:hypothetical protein
MAHNRIFPRIEQLESSRNPLGDHFIVFAKYLDKVLDSDWNIYIRQGMRGYARVDVVITHPHKGCMLINLLDWEDIKNYNNMDVTHPLADNSGFKTRKTFLYKTTKVPNPNQNLTKNRDLMLKNILPKINSNIQSLGWYKYKGFRRGIYFYNVSDSADLNKKNDGEKTLIPWKFKNISLFARDYVDNNLSFDNIITDYDKKWKVDLLDKDKDFWDSEWHSYIRQKIVLPYHKIEHGTYIKLTKEQERHVLPAENTHQRLKGVAGSGKTLVIGQRVAQIASLECKVLVVSFNITLTHYIEHQVGRACVGFDPNFIEYKHFHQVCWDFADQNGFDFSDKYIAKNNDGLYSIPKEDEKKYFTKDVPNRVISEIVNNDLKPQKYDAIIIDEGQDFHHSWYRMLELFLSDRNELLLVADDKQNVYGRDISWIDEMKDVQFRGKWRTLSISHRLPKAFIPVIKRFSDDYLQDHIQIGEKLEIESGAEQAFAFMRPMVKWVEAKKITPLSPNKPKIKNCRDCYKPILKNQEEKKKIRLCSSCQGHQGRCFEIIYDFISELVDKGSQLNDIVLLVPSNIQGKELREFLEIKGVKVMDSFSRNSKFAFSLLKDSDQIDDFIKITTIYSFKGWEMPHVIILTELDNVFTDTSNFLMYTALTRTLNSLFVVNRLTEYISFGKYLNSIGK